MEVWLLGAGALVLIAIAMWVVWPAEAAEAVGRAVRDKEVLSTPMTEGERPAMPQGDRFEDQYTSAMADLSPGGVLAAMQSMQDDEQAASSLTPGPLAPDAVSSQPVDSVSGQSAAGAPARPVTPYPAGPAGSPTAPPASAAGAARWPEADTHGEHIEQPAMSDRFPYESKRADAGWRPEPRHIGVGAAALLCLACAVAGAWAMRRWQERRQRPINRLRRRALQALSQIAERVPTPD